MVTLIDVAKKAGVSPSTVSRYIRTPHVVSKEKAEIIQKTINELGYSPNLGASLLKSNTANLVGLVIPNTYNYLFMTIINQLTNRLKAENKNLIVLYSTDFAEVKKCIKTLISLQCKSIIYIPEKASKTIDTYTKNNGIYSLQLFIDAMEQDDAIIIDDIQGAYIATKNLIKAGHKDIVLVDGDNEVFRKRKEGMKKAFLDSGIIFDEDRHLCPLTENIDVVRRVRKHLYNHETTAIVAVTEGIAQQVCLALQQIGKSIPDDISLVVYDDSQWAQLSNYSAIGHPINELIDNITNLLHLRNDDEKINKIVIPPIFIKRGSIKEI